MYRTEMCGVVQCRTEQLYGIVQGSYRVVRSGTVSYRIVRGGTVS